MKISKTYYTIWGKDYIYYVQAASSDIVYKLTSIINGVTKTVSEGTIVGSSLETITLTTEGQYQLAIYYPSNGAVKIDVYDIRCYPETKAEIISTLKDVICNCPSLGVDFSNCSSNSLSPTRQDVNLMEMAYNSMGLYTTLLMSPSFLRPYSCCFSNTLGLTYYKLESLIKDLYTTVTLNGYTPNSYYLMRLYTAYYYVMLYVMEMDMASCKTVGESIINPTPPDLDVIPVGDCTEAMVAVKTLFDLDTIMLCFTNIGLDFRTIYNEFYTCYVSNLTGICTITSVATPPIGYGEINNLTYTNYSLYVEIDTVVNPTIFSWEVEGTPVNLVLDDNGYGEIEDVSVTGNSYNTSASYTLADKGSVLWTLNGDNVSSITLQCNWTLPAYYGSNLTGDIPDETDILAGTKLVGDFATEIIYNPNTTELQYGWIAVPVDEAVQYTNWSVLNNAANGGIIGIHPTDEHFIKKNSAYIVVDGYNYRVYIYTYPSEVDDPLKLYKKQTISIT